MVVTRGEGGERAGNEDKGGQIYRDRMRTI